jgi:hypothetical protein
MHRSEIKIQNPKSKNPMSRDVAPVALNERHGLFHCAVQNGREQPGAIHFDRSNTGLSPFPERLGGR